MVLAVGLVALHVDLNRVKEALRAIHVIIAIFEVVFPAGVFDFGVFKGREEELRRTTNQV